MGQFSGKSRLRKNGASAATSHNAECFGYSFVTESMGLASVHLTAKDGSESYRFGWNDSKWRPLSKVIQGTDRKPVWDFLVVVFLLVNNSVLHCFHDVADYW